MNLVEQALGKIKSEGDNKRLPERIPRLDINTIVPNRLPFEDEELPILTSEELAEKLIISPGMSDRGVEESIIAIRTALLRRCGGVPCKVLVTSSTGRGGSQFVTVNLGVALASDPVMSAILIDCNLRVPSTEDGLLTDQRFGLSNFLFEDTDNIENIVAHVGIERLRLINSGSRSHAQRAFLTTARFRRVLDAIRGLYSDRFLIFDSPPVTVSSDTRILVDECDFVVLVAGYGRATLSSIQDSVDLIGTDKLLGVVLNKEPRWPFGMLQE